jgi:hypothetical protein
VQARVRARAPSCGVRGRRPEFPATGRFLQSPSAARISPRVSQGDRSRTDRWSRSQPLARAVGHRYARTPLWTEGRRCYRTLVRHRRRGDHHRTCGCHRHRHGDCRCNHLRASTRQSCPNRGPSCLCPRDPSGRDRQLPPPCRAHRAAGTPRWHLHLPRGVGWIGPQFLFPESGKDQPTSCAMHSCMRTQGPPGVSDKHAKLSRP